MSAQIPGWLKDTVVDSLLQAGASAPIGELETQATWILALWSNPAQVAHGIRYLANLLEKLDAFEGIAPDPATLRLAIIFSAATTTPAGCNEVSTRLERVSVNSETTHKITDLATMVASGVFPADQIESQILHDASLAVLATPPQVYAKHCASLALEARDIPRDQYLKARARYLRTVLHHRRIFRTPIGARWANALRNNFEGELARIEQILGSDDTNEPDTTPFEDTRTGPIVIRSSKARKLARLKHEEPQRSTRDKKKAQSAPREAAPPKAPSPEETSSSLEAVEDPFSHRKRR